ncbi:helix-turn-helix transcriptional regulator [Herbaspirillum sp. RTI4]|uniref:helix-turn-helix transcriptional regulator n=1 Tax=Herbaspirillum sp. RTI4 TaxID=3048640 RepID=UPI002AB5BDF4|nr:helix-turn-helix transcriptional regulator [Herbaspirillum sp. RTI4]MDY7578415.1 helix-turn-helix transcriptional regulator [Herbaspirillum sp. RTI4]MEA9982571.1 helix-turn-helix transcriptional regulator [Herbaspirillum sp. RTI4]
MNDSGKKTEMTLVAGAEEEKDPYLIALGERLRALRSRRGLTRKALARLADVSERHLANVESGVGNASIQFLRQLTGVLNCTLAEMIGDETATSPEWLMIREILRGRSDRELAEARTALSGVFETPTSERARRQRVALIGLRGAGKSSIGRMLADRWVVPFIELNRHIEVLAGCSVAEIHALYGPNAYRRYEFRALEDIIGRYPQAVIATPGGIVSDPATFNLLLSHCYTVWLQASPEEHMGRVVAQGDTRPMSGNKEAMQDLKEIIQSRTPFYSKADEVFDTSDMTQESAFLALDDQLRSVALPKL